MGRSLIDKIISLYILVKGTSAVGIRYKLEFDILNKSSSNFGNCPVPIRLAELHIYGTLCSIYFFFDV